MKHLKSKRSIGFRSKPLSKKKEPGAIFYLKKRASFWVAALSLFAFVIGNMMGQHGWYAFWASVLGEGERSSIAYTGTVAPLKEVVDYGCWARFGGDFKQHSFRQSPSQCRMSLPAYVPGSNGHNLISMQYMSSYKQQLEGTGNHPGIDIRVPVGTPVQTVMNGRVVRVGDQGGGFGKHVVIEHPNVPDPDHPTRKKTTLYSAYAHLSAVYVQEGQRVSRGEEVALTGNTGDSTGPHLDFQLTRDTAPFYPYYPSNQTEGYRHTVNPLLYIEANLTPLRDTEVVATTRSVDEPQAVVVPRRQERRRSARRMQASHSDSILRSSAPSEREVREDVAVPRVTFDPHESRKSVITKLQTRRQKRVEERLQRRRMRRNTYGIHTELPDVSGTERETVQIQEPEVIEVAAEEVVEVVHARGVDSVAIEHDRSFRGRGWETVRLRLLDTMGAPVSEETLAEDVHLKTAFGQADFRPAVLSILDFQDGEAVVHMLPRGKQTIVIRVEPFGVLSAPMEYDR